MSSEARTVTQQAEDDAYPRALADAERAFAQRCGRKDGAQRAIALSGGGIRSATFALGFFQGLARTPGLIGSFAMLSTVSGGGYFGSFLMRLFARLRRTFERADVTPSPADITEALECALADAPNSALRPAAGGKGHDAAREKAINAGRLALHWLRENGRYLAPGGGPDRLLAGAIILRNWLVLLLTLLLPLIVVFCLLQAARWGLVDAGAIAAMDWRRFLQAGVPASPYPYLAIALTFCLALPIAALYLIVPTTRSDRWHWLAKLVPAAVIYALIAAGLAVALFERVSWETVLEAVALPSFLGAIALLARASATPLRSPSVWIAAVLAFAPTIAWIALAIVMPVGHPYWRAFDDRVEAYVALAGAHALALVLLTLLAVPIAARHDSARGGYALPVDDRRRWAHHWFSRLLVMPLMFVAAVAAIGFIDAAGAYVAGWLASDLLAEKIGAIASSVIVGASAAMAFTRLVLDRLPRDKPMSAPMGLLAGLAATAIAALLALLAAVIAHAIAWQFAPPTPPDATGEASWLAALAAAGGALLLAICIGRWGDLAHSLSHQPFYRSRLVRAYLGATNPSRVTNTVSVTSPRDGDDVALGKLADQLEGSGAPLHLVNTTVNETVSPLMGTQSMDRKGMILAVSPVGMSLGKRHHATFGADDDAATSTGGERRITPIVAKSASFAPFGVNPRPIEDLSLGTWCGISGAAFTTGLGARTSIGLSALMALLNVRIGYWWHARAGERVDGRPTGAVRLIDRVAPFYSRVFDELLARFRGTNAPDWYLSDGGHFENLGVYELVRRRVPLIVSVDAEQDGANTFDGLATLIRKARLDFDACIDFLDADALALLRAGTSTGAGAAPIAIPDAVGTLDDLMRSAPPASAGSVQPPLVSRAHAALARVTYADGTTGWLVYVKATLTATSPLSLRLYAREHPAFPHQPTTDQFFDEAQWEAYRALGESVSAELFRPSAQWIVALRS